MLGVHASSAARVRSSEPRMAAPRFRRLPSRATGAAQGPHAHTILRHTHDVVRRIPGRIRRFVRQLPACGFERPTGTVASGGTRELVHPNWGRSKGVHRTSQHAPGARSNVTGRDPTVAKNCPRRSSRGQSERCTRHGFPTATLLAGMEWLTTLPAPIVTLSSISTPGRSVTFAPSRACLRPPHC